MVHSKGLVVAVRCRGKILRETYENGESVVKLPFCSEYEILIKNLETRRALINISIDGVSVSDGSIIVAANSSGNLEGFVKGYLVKNKFKFIEKTEEISDYRGDRIDDGIIRVEYTFEAHQPQIIHDYHYHHDHYHHHHDWWPYYGPWYHITYNAASCQSESNRSLTNKSSGVYSTAVQCNNVQTQNLTNNQGVTVPGAKSDQQLSPDYVGTLETNSHVIIIRLIGEKQGKKIEKAVFTKTKLSCPTCGRKSRSDSKFCKNCGTSLS